MALTLLVCSPRVAPGQLTRPAWTLLEAAVAPAATSAVAGHAAAVRKYEVAGVVDVVPGAPGDVNAYDVLLCASTDDAVAAGAPPDAPVVVGAADLPGARVLDLVAVMDRLRSPGGCPWDAEQTHESLAPYAVEEAYELADAVASGDRVEMADELGDVLLQVAFHARVAQDAADAPFGLDDVADRIVAKLCRRHPHVFADVVVAGTGDVEANWEAIKATEKPERTGPLDGIPSGLPPLERAAKVASRLERAGRRDDVLAAALGVVASGPGRELLVAAVRACHAGEDPSMSLRAALDDAEARLRASRGRTPG